MDKELLYKLYFNNIENILPISKTKTTENSYPIYTISGLFYTEKITLRKIVIFETVLALFCFFNYIINSRAGLSLFLLFAITFPLSMLFLEWIEISNIKKNVNQYLLAQKFLRQNHIIPLISLQETLPNCPIKTEISCFLELCQTQTRNYTEFNNIQIDISENLKKILTIPPNELARISR